MSLHTVAARRNGSLERTNLPNEYERMLLREATPCIQDFKEIRVLEQLFDNQSIVVAETLIVQRISKPLCHYALRIVELRNVSALRALFHEISVLKTLGLDQSIMSLFMAFRHRQYLGLLHPPFSTLRDKIDLLRRFKKSAGTNPAICFSEPGRRNRTSTKRSSQIAEQFLREHCIFNRNAVVYVLRQVISALEFLNSKNFVHTQICSSSVFIDDLCYVKLGSFLHCRRIGSKRCLVTGNHNLFPPEAFHNDSQFLIKPNIDTWAIGLFVLEMATGRRMRYSRTEMIDLAAKFINGTEAPPTLEETAPETFVRGKQIYDPHITNFLTECFSISYNKRKSPLELLTHPFLARFFNKEEAYLQIGVEPVKEIIWERGRSLRLDILTCHSHYAPLKQELLDQICNAVRLVHDKTCCPIFEEDLKMAKDKYFAVNASLAFLQDEDADWSREVLDASNASSPDRTILLPKTRANRRPTLSGEQIRRQNGNCPFEGRECQRCEMVFFVNRTLSMNNRHLFIALQFARWFERGLIDFADLIRVVDELDDILIDYIISSEPRPLSPYKHRTLTATPESVAFVSGLRRSFIERSPRDDVNNHRYNNIFVEVALSPDAVFKKKQKMDRLREGDTVLYPKDLGPLYASATFYELNIERLHLLESVMLGMRRINDWEFDVEQRVSDSADTSQTSLTTLLKARRENPNAKINSEIGWDVSNQAEQAKIWGDYKRDFLFRFAKYAIPYKLELETAKKLYETPRSSLSNSPIESLIERLPCGISDDDVELQLARTRSKQEEDITSPFKHHDDVEAREELVQKLMNDNHKKDLRIRSMEEQMEQLRAELKLKAVLDQSPLGVD